MPTPIDELERERRTLAWFDEHLGPGDEVALKDLLAIAKGDTGQEVLQRGMPVTRFPTPSERIAAWDLLMTRHRGRPAQKVEVKDTTVRTAAKWNPDAYTLEDLQELRRLVAKGAGAAVVEGEYTEVKGETPT